MPPTSAIFPHLTLAGHLRRYQRRRASRGRGIAFAAAERVCVLAPQPNGKEQGPPTFDLVPAEFVWLDRPQRVQEGQQDYGRIQVAVPVPWSLDLPRV
jgi:hypothetical protein